MADNKEFIAGKKNALNALEKACDMKEVDEEILPILHLINESSNYYTSSSCTGRTVLLEIPNIGDKKEAVFLGRWHRTIESDEIKSAAEKAKHGLLWILAQSPIIHIVTDTSENADELVKAAIACGFKNSGFKSLSKKIVIEICSTERLDAPVGRDGNLFCNSKYLDLLVDIANDVFIKSKEKLVRLEKTLMKKY